MIRVLNVTSDSNIGGAGRCILNYLAHCDRAAFDVSVVLPRGSLLLPEVERLGFSAVQVDGIGDKSLDLGGIRNLKAVIRERRPQVVHTHGAMSGRIAARQAGAAVVYTRHSVFPVKRILSRQPGKFLNGKINEYYADAIIAVAEAAKENLTDSGISPDRVEVILNGVQAQRRLPPAEIAAEKKRYGIPEGAVVAGILARLETVKGHSYLLQAVRLLRERGLSIVLLIAGAGSLEADLRAEAEGLGLGESVRFLGFVQDIPRLLSVLDLQLNASYGTEATSLALLEGMSMGIPAVVTDYGGNPGVIRNGENGLLVPIRDSGAMADAIQSVAEDRAGYDRMAENCRRIFAETFTADIYARNIEAVYRRAAERKRGE